MLLQGTNEVVKALNDFYIQNYKEAYSKYLLELEFTTILTYYSGNCSLVINMNSTAVAATHSNMCIMLECREEDLLHLDDAAMHSFFIEKISKQYAGLFELNRVLCSKRLNRKLIIKNTNFNEGLLNIKLDKDVLQLELNYRKIIELNKEEQDLLEAIEGLSQHLRSFL